jgi:trans-aconitate 2-methyltransferase
MPTWSPEQYLLFAEDRTRPSRELAARVRTERVNTIIDLGCGPGNSTAVLAELWPDATITGLDSSVEMLDEARRMYPQQRWVHGDISEWSTATAEPYDLVFSNAALHWIAGHATLYPRLFARVAAGGTLAIQVPYNWDEPFHRILCDLESSSAWRQRLPSTGVRAKSGHDAGFYYDVLAPAATSTNLWETRYVIVLPDVESIVEWNKGTALRPFLDALPNEADRKNFIDDFTGALRSEYLPRADGKVLFPFRRLFLVARR